MDKYTKAVLAVVSLFAFVLPVKAHQIIHDGFRQATLEDINLWNDEYTCDLQKIVEVDDNGMGTSSIIEGDQPFVFKIDKQELTIDDGGVLMTSGPVISIMGMHISKAYGGELIAHSNIGHMLLDKDGNFFWSQSSFNWSAGSLGILFIKGLCK